MCSINAEMADKNPIKFRYDFLAQLTGTNAQRLRRRRLSFDDVILVVRGDVLALQAQQPGVAVRQRGRQAVSPVTGRQL